MFRIDPNALYSSEDLDRELEGLMDAKTFLLRINPRKRYKSAWWGQDLIDALDSRIPEVRPATMSSQLAVRKRPAVRYGTRRTVPGLEPIEMSEDTKDVLDPERP